MFTGSAILTWLASKGVSLLLGAAFGFLQDWLSNQRAAAAQRAAGRAETEAAQAEQGKKVEAEIADEAAKTVTEDDAIKRMEEGTA